jgi:hypothetical protein
MVTSIEYLTTYTSQKKKKKLYREEKYQQFITERQHQGIEMVLLSAHLE